MPCKNGIVLHNCKDD
ncbi:MAG: hypothetical protein DMG41_32205 [Acidobacteria bacterium]|nr:MAG: hypothetical protein DMG42_11235 [Acidobacteriota bacterium]PYT83012.1 MAG: hypothetical protein DMG41_32205 [Acidobacteriota bacterium]